MNERKSGIMRVGLPLNQKDRAALGEQFRDDVNALTETLFTRLKKNKSPQGDAETGWAIRFNCVDIGDFLDEYARFLSVKKVYCIHCKLCGEFFLASAWNTRYCDDCCGASKDIGVDICRNADVTMSEQPLPYFI